MGKFDVLTISDLCTDLMLFGDVVPEFVQCEKIINSYTIDMGGSCSIFACQTAKLGMHTGVIGSVGDDPFGRLVLDRLTEAGVDTRYVRSGEVCTGLSTILCREGGDRAILTVSGGIDHINLADVKQAVQEGVKHLHIGSFYLMKQMMPYWKDIIKAVKAGGGTVSLDTNYDPAESWSSVLEILPMVDVFLPNETELCAIAGCDTVEESLEKLSPMVKQCVVKLGKNGATAISNGKRYHWDSIDVPVVDAVGAGDTFDAGYVYAFCKGYDVETCGRIATFCSSGNVQKAGGVAGQRTMEEMKQWESNCTNQQ